MKKINRKLVYSFIIISFALILNNACKKEDNNNPVIPATVIDIDGNVYHTVTIGTQVWMVENLKTTKFRNGTSIPNVTDNSEWASLTKSAYCNYSNNDSLANVYGRLYNWYAVNDSNKIAPLGWHIPSLTELNKMISFLGGDSIAGSKLKEANTLHWSSPNKGATNETGFTALPGGYRGFGSINNYGIWWTSTEDNSINAWHYYMSYNSIDIIRYSDSKRNGFSVRCVKD